LAEDSPCQDSNIVKVLGRNSSLGLVACVADGAGSAKYSEEGSSIACDTILEKAVSFFSSQDSFEGLQYDDVLAWCDEACLRIAAAAEIHGCATRELATTLCVAILSQNRSYFFQIGDGAIVVKRNGTCGVVFWPQSGEYANTTNFLTSPDYQKHLEFLKSASSFSDLALITDGLERLALQFDNQTPHVPFFHPLFGALRSTSDLNKLSEELQRFLESDSVRGKSDDDLTIVLASRISEEGDEDV
jgi:serine/threonine protein phosphatase PrpC